MDTKKLRQKILDLAIRGKLVAQNPEDEPASVLLQRIRAEKERLIAEGKIKRPKKSKTSSSESHYRNFTPPFEIPDSWEWSTLGEIFSMQSGKNVQATELQEYNSQNTYPCFGGNGVRGYLSRYNHDGTYPIIGRQGALCGNINIAKGKFYATEHAVVVNYFANTDVMLWALFLENLNLNQYATATAQPGLSVAKLGEIPIPIPPIQEQKRIVEAVQDWMKCIGKLSVSSAQLSESVDFAKSKILDLAMRGKLVPQDPADEPATDMLRRINPKAKIITDNPHSWNMPNGWCLCELRDLCTFLSRGKSPKYSDVPNQYPVFAQKCNLKDGGISLNQARFLDESTLPKWPNKYKLKDQDILVNSTGTGTVGRTRLFLNKYLKEFPFVLPDSHVSVVRTFDEIDSKFIYFNLISREGQTYFNDNLSGSTNQKELYIEAIGNKLIFLPPKKETERIVTKIEELYHCIDKIEATLQS